MNVGDKVKIKKDIPSVNGMLHRDTIVKIDEISGDHPSGSPFRGSIRVTDNLGKIWWENSTDISKEIL